MRKDGVTGYVKPNDAGLNSEPRAVGRRLGKLLDALADQVNSWICQGPIDEDVRRFRQELTEKLIADGWEVRVGAHDRYIVKPGKAYWESLREVKS